MASEHDRIRTLAGRVRWLDRYRRLIAIGAAIVSAPLLILELSSVLGAEWPEMHATLLSIMCGVILWWIVEVALVWLTAVWETECDRLIRDRGVPPARVVLRK